MKCPHCGHEITLLLYDSNDPAQKRGFDDTVWNNTEGEPGRFRLNPYPVNSDDYYRWNRGYHAAMRK